MEECAVHEPESSRFKSVNVVLGALLGLIYGFFKYGLFGAVIGAIVGGFTGFGGIMLPVVAFSLIVLVMWWLG